MTWTLLLAALSAYLGGSVGYVLLMAVAGRWYVEPAYSSPEHWPQLAVFIPAYKEDAVIVDTARAAADHDYPGAFDVVVIADSLQPETISALADAPVTVVKVTFDNSTKTKALNAALQQCTWEPYDGAVILDADNVMAPGFLAYMGQALAAGATVIQGRRTAKNLDSGIAQLDGFSEALNNHLFRRGHRTLGLSSALIGSGMAFEASVYRDVLPQIEAVGGFDKELELRLIQAGHTIEYVERAVVYDEKVRAHTSFVTQRRRWLAAQAHYLQRSLIPAVAHGFYGCLDYANKVVQMLLPPRSVLLGLLPTLTLVAILVGTTVTAWVLGACTVLFVVSLVLSVPRDRTDLHFWTAVRHLPGGIGLMFLALFRSPGSNRTFLNTPHGSADQPESSSTDS